MYLIHIIICNVIHIIYSIHNVLNTYIYFINTYVTCMVVLTHITYEYITLHILYIDYYEYNHILILYIYIYIYTYMEKEVATHSSVLASKIPWTDWAWQPTVCGVVKELDMTEWLNNIHIYYTYLIYDVYELCILINYKHIHIIQASLVAQQLKNLPAMQETWVWSLGWEDPLEKGKATHSSILAWRIPWTIVYGVAESQTWLTFTSHTHNIYYMTTLIYKWHV